MWPFWYAVCCVLCIEQKEWNVGCHHLWHTISGARCFGCNNSFGCQTHTPWPPLCCSCLLLLIAKMPSPSTVCISTECRRRRRPVRNIFAAAANRKPTFSQFSIKCNTLFWCLVFAVAIDQMHCVSTPPSLILLAHCLLWVEISNNSDTFVYSLDFSAGPPLQDLWRK